MRLPAIDITGKKTIRAKAHRVSIRGTTRGDVLQVRYLVYRGRSGTAHGLSKWQFRVPLKYRKTTILVTATGYNQKKSTAKVVVLKR